jgi:type IV pilus assembly protein PilE
MDVRRRISGFTLIELLIVFTIVGLLASIAYPSYQQYFVKANRAAVQQFLLNAASMQHQYFLASNGSSYANQTELLGVDGLLIVPSRVSDFYIVSVGVAVQESAPAFFVAATPIEESIQSMDGVLSIDNTGLKIGMW